MFKVFTNLVLFVVVCYIIIVAIVRMNCSWHTVLVPIWRILHFQLLALLGCVVTRLEMFLLYKLVRVIFYTMIVKAFFFRTNNM